MAHSHFIIGGGSLSGLPSGLISAVLKDMLGEENIAPGKRAAIELALKQHEAGCPECDGAPTGKVGKLTEPEAALHGSIEKARRNVEKLKELHENLGTRADQMHADVVDAILRGPIPIPVEMQQALHEVMNKGEDMEAQIDKLQASIEQSEREFFTTVMHRLDIPRDINFSIGKIDHLVKMTKTEAEKVPGLTWEPLHPEDPAHNKA